MPVLQLTGPDGSIKKVRVSEMPSDDQMNEIIQRAFAPPVQQQAPLGQPEEPGQGAQSAQPYKPIGDTIGSPLPDAQDIMRQQAPQETRAEQSLDIQEAAQRPGIGEGLGQTVRSAGRQVGEIVDIAAEVAKNPIGAAKAVKTALSNATADDVAQFGLNMLSDFGRNFGVDMSRPGVGLDKVDLDVAIDKWTNQPLSALGDMALVTGVGKKVAGKVATTGAKGVAKDKIAMHGALKRSGDKIQEMQEAANKAIERGGKVDTKTPGQEVAEKGSVIRKMSLKNLGSEKYVRDRSVELADRIFSIGRKESQVMNKALDKVKDKKVDSRGLSESIKGSLLEEGFAETAKDAVDVAVEGAKGSVDKVNVIAPINKSKLDAFINRLDSGEEMSVKDLKNVMDVIDDSVNYVTDKASDKGLKIMRGEIRKALGGVSKEYDEVATRIHDRLTQIGYAEKKIRKARKEGYLRDYKEKVGLEIAKSDERSKVFREAMDVVGGEVAGSALGRFQLIDAWAAWNDLYQTNQSVFKIAGDVRGRLVDKVYTAGAQRVRKAFPETDIPTAIKAGASKVGSGAASGAKGAAKGAAVGTTLADSLSEIE